MRLLFLFIRCFIFILLQLKRPPLLVVFLALLAAHCYLPRLVATPYGAPEQRQSRNPAPVFAFAGSGFRSSDWATSEPRDVGPIQLTVTFPDFHGAASYALVLFYHIIKGTASQAVRDEGKISHGFIFGGGEHMPVRMSGSIKN